MGRHRNAARQPKGKAMLKIVYHCGPFKNEFGLADPAKMAPLDMQPNKVLRAVLSHSRSVDCRKEAQRLLADRVAV